MGKKRISLSLSHLGRETRAGRLAKDSRSRGLPFSASDDSLSIDGDGGSFVPFLKEGGGKGTVEGQFAIRVKARASTDRQPEISISFTRRSFTHSLSLSRSSRERIERRGARGVPASTAAQREQRRPASRRRSQAITRLPLLPQTQGSINQRQNIYR